MNKRQLQKIIKAKKPLTLYLINRKEKTGYIINVVEIDGEWDDRFNVISINDGDFDLGCDDLVYFNYWDFRKKFAKCKDYELVDDRSGQWRFVNLATVR